jgi:hypothetical protein
MDSSYSIRTQRPIYTARDPVAVRGAVATELDTSKTVGAADREAGQQRRDPREDHPHQDRAAKESAAKESASKEPSRDQIPHDVVADSASREVIYRERDVRANGGEHPDHALLRQRAYRLPYTGSTEAPLQPSDPHADFKA